MYSHIFFIRPCGKVLLFQGNYFDDKIIGGDAPSPLGIRQLCKPSDRPKGDSGASVFPSKPGHWNQPQEAQHPSSSTLCSQENHRQIHGRNMLLARSMVDKWRKARESPDGKPWGLAAKYNCPFLKGCLCRCGSDSSESGASLGARPGHVQSGAPCTMA